MNATATIEKPSVSDEVLREVWRIKDELSESYGHDIEKLFADIQKKQRLSGRRIVNLQTIGEHRKF